MYPNKPIHLREIGYPSSEALKSSEEMQAEFVVHAFEAWDIYKDHIPLLSFLWLTEKSSSDLDAFGLYYGSNLKILRDMLGSLGFRHADETEKPALKVLRAEAKKSGW